MPDRFAPADVLGSFRRLNPGKFDEFSDADLLDSIQRLDPETYKLVDPLLVGAEILPSLSRPPGGPPSRPRPLPTPAAQPTWTDSAITSGLRIVPAIGGAMAGGVVGAVGGPPGIAASVAVGGAAGSGSGEALAQWYERKVGLREGWSPWEIALATGLGAVNPGAKALTVGGRIAEQAAIGAGLGIVGSEGRSLIEEGQLAPPGRALTEGAMGAAFGGATHGAVEGTGAALRAGRRAAPSFGDSTGRLPGDLGPPPGPSDTAPLKAAIDQVYQSEEARMAAELQAKFGAGASVGKRGDYHTALEAKRSLENLVDLVGAKQQADQLIVSMGRTGATAMEGPPVSPFGAPPQRALPSAPFYGTSTGEVAPAGRQGELPGAGFNPYAGPTPPPTLGQAITQATAGTAEPGGPRLVLQSEEVPGAPPPAGQRQLLPPPRRNLNSPLEQTGEMGGLPATAEQPRIPGIEHGKPVARTYPEGPNVGPRRNPRQELHQVSRPYRRQIQVEGKTKYEYPSSTLPAEDPGTYPPEVRREMARMVHELETMRYEQFAGGTTQKQRESLLASGDTTYGRATGASAGGSIAGAPVYHDILEAANGPKRHAAASDVLTDLRAALLEGKGSHLSDAAAVVARARMAKEAETAGLSSRERKLTKSYTTPPSGKRRERLAIVSEPGAGDHLIGWEDAAGNRALPDQDLSEWQRMARDTDDGEILATSRLVKANGGLQELPEAVREGYAEILNEGVRRGLLTPEQLALQMEGPGGAGGPTLFDFEGGEAEGPPRKPTRPGGADTAEAPPPAPPPGLDTVAREEYQRYRQAQIERDMETRRAEGVPDNPAAQKMERERVAAGIAGEREPALPGLEGVRQEERPMPRLAEEPFGLTPPPRKPAKAAAPTQRPLFGTPEYSQWYQTLSPMEKIKERFTSEEGVLVLNVPAGDRVGLKKWLQKQEAEHGGEAWFSRVEHFIEAGEWDKAWKSAAGASARSYVMAYRDAKSPQEERVLESMVRGTPLQTDVNTQIIAGARQRAGVNEAPPAGYRPVTGAATMFPPSRTVTQAGAARGKATLGPAGILNPGRPKRPLSAAAPELRGGNLDKEVVRLILEATKAEGKATVPGNTDTFNRLFRQIGEDVYKGENLKLLREAGVRIPPEELAQHFNNTVSEWGRGLQMLQQFAETNKVTLEEAAQMQNIGGALRGTLDPSAPPPRFTGAGGRQISEPGARATVEALAHDTQFYEQAMMTNTLQKRPAVGPLRALHDASYAFMLSKWNTAVRNYASFTGRYSIDSLDHALTIPIATLTGDTQTGALAKAQVRERGWTPFRKGSAVSPRRAWGETLQDIHNFTIDSVNQLPPEDARRALSLLLNQPEHLAEYLGTMTGEDLSAGFSNTPVLRHLTNPKVQRFLTMFNRAQEFSARATVFDSTMRALLRAEGHNPTDLLQRPFSEIEAAVGAAKLDDHLFTATAQALEATFAGRVSKDSLPGALIRGMNAWWPLKLGFPFPKFNISAAPRWLYDHSPAALFDLIRFPLDAAGITAPAGTMAGGRLYRGMRAQTIERKGLPQIAGQIGKAERAQGTALAELLSTAREAQIRSRQVSRLEARAQQGLPNVQTALGVAREARDQLLRRRETLKSQMQEARRTVGDLKSEQKRLLSVVQDAKGINAPNFAQFVARQTVGTVGMLGAAWVVRAQPGAEGTRWYEYRVDREGKDPVVLDFRPFAPFAQYLFVADVLHDFNQHTNWEDYHKQLAEQEGIAGPLDVSRAIWNNYEGKYTSEELGSQFAQAFLSISRAAGTTLTLADLMTQNGWPGPQEAADAIVGTIGQFLSRFTVPLSQGRDIVGQFDPEEAKTRTPPRATVQDWERPLGAPIANVPYASRIIPDTISQTTGKPVASEYPLLRGAAGVGATPRDFVTEEVRRVGVPGQSVYIRETGDVGLDRMVAESYAAILQDQLPGILEDPTYRGLGTPARQRDFLTRYIFPALKRAALGEVRSSIPAEQFAGATIRGEAARRAARQARMLADLEEGLPAAPQTDGPPPAGPGGGTPLEAPPPPPMP